VPEIKGLEITRRLWPPLPIQDRLGVVGEVLPYGRDRWVFRVGLVGQSAAPVAVRLAEPALNVAGVPSAADADPDPMAPRVEAGCTGGRGGDRSGVARHIPDHRTFMRMAATGGCGVIATRR